MFTLIPISPQDIHRWWPMIHEGLLKVSEKCNRGDYTYPRIMADLIRGASVLFIGQIDGSYKGFVIVQPSQYDMGPRCLNVVAMYSILDSREEWSKGYEILDEFTKKTNASFQEMRTMRKGFEKILPEQGWEPVYTVWRRDICTSSQD